MAAISCCRSASSLSCLAVERSVSSRLVAAVLALCFMVACLMFGRDGERSESKRSCPCLGVRGWSSGCRCVGVIGSVAVGVGDVACGGVLVGLAMTASMRVRCT